MKKAKMPLLQADLSKLANDSKSYVKDHTLRDGFTKPVKNVTEHIDTVTPLATIKNGVEQINNKIQSTISPNELQDKIAQFRADRALKRVANEAPSMMDDIASVAGKALRSPMTKKAALAAIAGPASMALNAADAMASVEGVGEGSDEVGQFQNEEALLNIPAENFADPAVSEQARRWQKIRGLMGE